MTSDFITFFRETIHNFRDTGSVAPSSKFLARKMVHPIIIRENMTIVELGPGTGSFTKELLRIIPDDAKLFSVEINSSLVRKLRSNIQDKRLEIIEGDAQKLRSILDKRGIDKVDYIVSGIPLGNLPVSIRSAIYENIYKCLKPEGKYIQFQYFLANYMEMRKRFHITNLSYELRNIPPAFVYTIRLHNSR